MEKNIDNNSANNSSETIQSFFANPYEFMKSVVRTVLAETSTIETSYDNDLISLDIAHKTILSNLYKKPYLYQLVSNKAIPSIKIGKKVMFRKTELLAWVAAGCYDYGKAQIEKAKKSQSIIIMEDGLLLLDKSAELATKKETT